MTFTKGMILSVVLVLGGPVLIASGDPPAATEKAPSGGVKESIKKAASAVGNTVRKGYHSAKKGVVSAGNALNRGNNKARRGGKSGAKETKEGEKKGEGSGDQAAQ